MDTMTIGQQPQQPQQQPPQQQDPATLAMIALPIGVWNQVIEFMGKNPWNEVNPFIFEMHRQMRIALQAQGSTAREPERATSET